MLLFGFLKLGFLVRFISNAVMVGFLSGLGAITILGQAGDLTGYYSEASNKVFQTLDTIFNFREIDPATFIVGLLTILSYQVPVLPFINSDISIARCAFSTGRQCGLRRR